MKTRKLVNVILIVAVLIASTFGLAYANPKESPATTSVESTMASSAIVPAEGKGTYSPYKRGDEVWVNKGKLHNHGCKSVDCAIDLAKFRPFESDAGYNDRVAACQVEVSAEYGVYQYADRGYYIVYIDGMPLAFPKANVTFKAYGPGWRGSSASSSQSAKICTYTVVRGDTLSKIAGKFGSTVAAFMYANGITDANCISVGQVLRVPGCK